MNSLLRQRRWGGSVFLLGQSPTPASQTPISSWPPPCALFLLLWVWYRVFRVVLLVRFVSSTPAFACLACTSTTRSSLSWNLPSNPDVSWETFKRETVSETYLYSELNYNIKYAVYKIISISYQCEFVYLNYKLFKAIKLSSSVKYLNIIWNLFSLLKILTHINNQVF